MTKPRLKIDLITTIERRPSSRWTTPAVIAAVFALLGFLAGSVATATTGPSSTQALMSTAESAASWPVAPGPARSCTVESGFSTNPSGANGEALGSGATTARFVPLVEPVEIVRSRTDPARGNAIGFSVGSVLDHALGSGASWSGESVLAIVADVAVSGSGPGTVLIHPGDAPDQALYMQLTNSGQLRASRMLLQPDGHGRVVIAADPKGDQVGAVAGAPARSVDVTVTAHAVYLESEASRSGRYHHIGVDGVASLVTATDGRDIILDVGDTAGLDVRTVGHAVLRIRANVGSEGASVSQLPSAGSERAGERPLIAWARPSSADAGLGGAGVVVAPVDADGRVGLRFRGGSMMTVDLLGYFTNEAAELSATGLLVALPATSSGFWCLDHYEP